MDGVFYMYIRKIIICFISILLSGLLLLASWAGWRQTQLSAHLIRLHVVANSDTDADQSLKLIVRDAVLVRCQELLAQTEDTAQAVSVLQAALPVLAQTGAEAVEQQGYGYPVRVRLEYADYPKTDYEDFSLPAGCYRGLRVEIGEAAGHNWWCVVFPSLCFGGVSEVSETAMAKEVTEDDLNLVTQSDEGYVIRFRCVELWQELLQKVKGFFSTP